MAGIITLPRAPQTGLSRLGDVIYASAAEYAGTRRADDREARLRAQRLADVESDRGYARGEGDRLYSRGRDDRLADVESDRTYQGMLHRRDRGEKLADLEEARDWQMIGAEMERSIRNNPEGIAQAQQRLNQLADDEAGIVRRMTARESSLGASEPQPNPQEVENLAMQRARLSIPKAGMFGSQRTQPSKEEIATQIPAVVDELRAQTNAAWQRARLDNQEQQRIDAVLLQRIGAEKNTITNVFRRVGIAGGNVPATSPAEGGLRDIIAAPSAAAPAPVQPPTLQQAQQNFRAGLVPAGPPPLMGGAGGNWGPSPAPASGQPGLLTEPQPVNNQTFKGGLLGAAERFASGPAFALPVAPAPNVGRLMDVPMNIDRAIGGAATGLLTGDFSVPPVGGLGQLGTYLSEGASSADQQADDNILRVAPYSARAYAIRRQRGIPDPQPVMR